MPAVKGRLFFVSDLVDSGLYCFSSTLAEAFRVIQKYRS